MPTLAARMIALLLLVLSAPLLLLIALVVWFGLGRPILFRQRRSGLHGIPFAMIKFRTMTSERDSAGQLLPDEQRLPALGRLLRRLRFDELPELLNLVRSCRKRSAPWRRRGSAGAPCGQV